jgi:hypothetical protein
VVVVVVGLPVVAPGLPIYEHIRRHVDPSGRLPAEVGLPDDGRTPLTRKGDWAPGAVDGIFSFHGSGSSPRRAAEIAGLLVSACRRPSVRNLRALYEGAAPDGVMGYVDVLADALRADPPSSSVLHAIGKWLATTAPDRGPVKLGIALLGITGPGADLAVVRTLGTHEEFTVFCADAMSNGLADPESELWALAASVDGWGRIECVDRLRDTTDPDIRAWLLREGYRNSIMYEYLAYTAATTGGLLEALHGEVDRGLLTAAGELLAALVDKGGPAEDIDDYESGADAVAAYLALMTTRAETLRDFSAVAAIRGFLAGETGWDERVRYGWTATRRQAFENACDEILHRESWRGLITEELSSGDVHLANRAARYLGMITFDVNVEKIKDDPLGDAWFDAWQQADTPRARLLANLARTLLPLDRIATGPGDELGLDVRWRAHTALNWTVQALRDHPGIGADLLLTCLHSPVTANRNMALRALARWPRATWPSTARETVRTMATTDPNDDTRRFASQLSTED